MGIFSIYVKDKKGRLRKAPDCTCRTCDKEFHHQGIMSHRAAHRRRNESCVIEYSDGRVVSHAFGPLLAVSGGDN